MLFHLRDSEGNVCDTESLEGALQIFTSDKGYRLSFVLNDGYELHIYRDEYDDNHPSHLSDFSHIQSRVADAKVILSRFTKAPKLPNLTLVK